MAVAKKAKVQSEFNFTALNVNTKYYSEPHQNKILIGS